MSREEYVRSYPDEVESAVWSMPPLYHRVLHWLRLSANRKLGLECTPRGGMWVSPGMLITSHALIGRGVAHKEYGIARPPNKKTVATILQWLKANHYILLESNDFGTVILLVDWERYAPRRTEKVTASAPRKPAAASPMSSPEALQLARLLAKKVYENNPKNRELTPERREATMARWAADLDRLLREDRQDYEAVGKAIIWSQKQRWWKKQVTSGEELRKHWDKVYLEMREERPRITEPVPPPKNVENAEMYKYMDALRKKYAS